MASVNKVILIGNLGRDPEIRMTQSGEAIANLSLATTDTWVDKQTGQKQESTEWHRVTFFGKTAEIAGQYLKKGSSVYVEGSIRTRKWHDEASGQERYTTEIRGDRMQMLGSRNDTTQAQPNQTPPPPTATRHAIPTKQPLEDIDSDIPF